MHLTFKCPVSASMCVCVLCHSGAKAAHTPEPLPFTTEIIQIYSCTFLLLFSGIIMSTIECKYTKLQFTIDSIEVSKELDTCVSLVYRHRGV